MTTKTNLPKKSKSKVIQIAAQELRIHPRAQRELKASKLKELKQKFDLDGIGVLSAVEYEIDGVTAIWIIDGQHRWQTLIDLGLGEWEVQVEIILGCKTDARASQLFLERNNRLSVHPYAKFDNAYKAGEGDAVGITRLAQERHLTVDRSSRDGCVCCVTVLTTVFNFDQGEALAATLDTVLAAWGHTAAAVEGRILGGLGLVYKHFNGTIDRAALVKKLAKYPGGPSKLIGDARGLREFRHVSIPRCVAERVIEVYNAGRRIGRLDPL